MIHDDSIYMSHDEITKMTFLNFYHYKSDENNFIDFSHNAKNDEIGTRKFKDTAGFITKNT